MATTEDPIGEGINALAQFFVGEMTMGDTLTRVSELARDALGADMAGITMLLDGTPATGVFTDPTAVDIDQAQYGPDGEGPCIDAFHQQTVFSITDTNSDTRWADFAAAAAGHGVRSTLSLPLTRTGEPLGALNLYSRTVGHFDTRTDDATALALQAAIVLANAHAYHDTRELSENLNQALTSRATIDYAIGILMAAGGRSPDDAFQLLVRASQRENRKLRDIAAAIVTFAQHRTPPST